MRSAGREPRPLVVGVGSPDRSDDGIGPAVVRALRADGAVDADLVEAPGDLTRLLDVWEGRASVVVIDAVRSGAPPGTVHRWDRADAVRLPSSARVSSHGLGLADVLRLAERIGRLPPRLAVIGIEIGATTVGTGRSPAVDAAVPAACRRVADALGATGPPSSPTAPGGAVRA